MADELEAIEQVYPIDTDVCGRLASLVENIPDAEEAFPLAEKAAALQKRFLARLEFERKLSAFGGFPNDLHRWKEFLLKTSAVQSQETDFAGAAAAIDLLFPLEDWNAFITRSAEPLNHFAVTSETAQAALDFYTNKQSQLGFLPQWKILDSRLADWTGDAHPAAICQSISALLNFPLEEAWIYEPKPGQYFYLTEPPREGKNTYRANLFGGTGSISLTAEETLSVQHLTIGERYGRWRAAAEALTDDLRPSSPSRWYGGWSALMIDIRANGIDPLLTAYLLRDTAKILSRGDRHFASRIGVWYMLLTVERIPDGLDPFDGSQPTITARQTAAEILPFLPTTQLAVDKDDSQLDELTEKLSGIYHPIGWLDTDTRGNWFLRADDSGDEVVSRHVVLFVPGANTVSSADITSSVSTVSSTDTVPHANTVTHASTVTQASTVLRAVDLGVIPCVTGPIPLVCNGLIRGLPLFSVE